MLNRIVHVGLTVTNIEKSIAFYRDVLGLEFQGQMIMEGDSTEKLFGMSPCKVKVAYLIGNEKMNMPTIELIQFETQLKEEPEIRLNKTSISEVCFCVSNIEEVYSQLKERGVEFLSPPQYFDLSSQGFGRSKAVYFRDPDGIILELMETIE